MKFNRSVVLLSGGLDSSTVLAVALTESTHVIALSFRYGQRHGIEEAASTFQVQEQGASLPSNRSLTHVFANIDLNQWGGSALTDPTIKVPKNGGTTPGIPPTYVPGRNTVLIAIAASMAEAYQAEAIYTGVNALDYSGYPDCRPEYIAAYNNLLRLSSKTAVEGKPIQIQAPIINLNKTEILDLAIKLGVDLANTWSCYAPIAINASQYEPCGLCDSCLIRSAAFRSRGMADPAMAKAFSLA